MRSTFGASSIPVDGAGPIAHVISEGKLLRIPVVDGEALATLFRAQDAQVLTDIELRSLLVVPLIVHGTTIAVDPTQMEQVIMNLAVNARDAMPGGGTLRISTGNVVIEDAQAEATGLLPGDYVRLTVSDTGVGIDAPTMSRIFEPSFTTKEKGKGTVLDEADVRREAG